MCMFDLLQFPIEPLNKKDRFRQKEVFSNLFNDFTELLTVGIIVFMLVMMVYLFSMLIIKSSRAVSRYQLVNKFEYDIRSCTS